MSSLRWPRVDGSEGNSRLSTTIDCKVLFDPAVSPSASCCFVLPGVTFRREALPFRSAGFVWDFCAVCRGVRCEGLAMFLLMLAGRPSVLPIDGWVTDRDTGL